VDVKSNCRRHERRRRNDNDNGRADTVGRVCANAEEKMTRVRVMSRTRRFIFYIKSGEVFFFFFIYNALVADSHGRTLKGDKKRKSIFFFFFR